MRCRSGKVRWKTKMRETPAGVLRNQKNTFAAVAEEFFKRKLAKTRKGLETSPCGRIRPCSEASCHSSG